MIALPIPPRKYRGRGKLVRDARSTHPGNQPKSYNAAHPLFSIQPPRTSLQIDEYVFFRYLVRHHSIDYRRIVWAMGSQLAISLVSKQTGFNPEELSVEPHGYIPNLSFLPEKLETGDPE